LIGKLSIKLIEILKLRAKNTKKVLDKDLSFELVMNKIKLKNDLDENQINL
jgi:hypothetical protein